MPPIAAFDIDLTIHREGLFIILMQALVERGYIPRQTIEHPTVLEHMRRKRRGLQRDYAYAIVDQFCALESVKGVRQDVLIQVAEELLPEHGDHTWLFPRLLLEAVKEQGYIAVAISGSPTEIVRPFTRQWGFEDCLGTELHLDGNGCFSGQADKEVRHYKNKDSCLERLAAKHNCTLERSIAIGDSMDDFAMLKNVTYPLAMNPSNELRQTCRNLCIPMIVEYGDSITVLQSSPSTKVFQETELSQVVPSVLAERILEKAEGRISSL